MRGSESNAGEVSGGEEGSGWRAKVRDYLAANVENPPISFGEIVDHFTPIIPRVEVERFWRSARPNEADEMVAPNRKYQTILQRELTRYPLQVLGTAGASGKQWTRATSVRAIARPCKFCGAPFVAHHKTITCSPSHGSKLRWTAEARPQVSRDPTSPIEQGMEIMAQSGKYPELGAVEMIADALRSLDREAWDRVMTYAKHLAETVADNKPPQLRVVAPEDAAD